MAQLIPMPQLGSTMEEGTIVKWRFQEGDFVRKGETLLEIETDKATMEVEAPADGVVRKLLYPADAVVAIQKPIAILGTVDEPIDHLLLSSGGSTASSTVATPAATPVVTAPPVAALASGSGDVSVFLSPRARKLAEESGVSFALLAGSGTGPEGRVVERDVQQFIARTGAAVAEPEDVSRGLKSTPLAAKMAGELGLDLNDLALGLPGSRVRREDVIRHLEGTATQERASAGSVRPSGSVPGSAEVLFTSRPFSGMRKRIADNVSKSRFTAPHVTLTLEVDMTECSELRSKIIPDIEKLFGTRLTFTDILVRATARVLDEQPIMNSALIGDELRVYAKKNIGVAVALDEGLIVPVVQDAGAKSLGAISAELKPLIDRARTGKFTPDDLAGGTFTITNLGSFGIDVFDPIIVPPQTAILGVCRIADKPVVVNKQVVIRSMMNLCLSFDHRIVDGAPAAKFLQRLKQLLESPISMLL